MDIPTNYLINKDTERSISLVIGTRPFWTIGIDINGKSIFFIMLNTHNMVVTVNLAGKRIHL